MNHPFFILLIIIFVSTIIVVDIIFDKSNIQSRYHITCLDGIEYWESRNILAIRIDVVTMQPAKCICR